ncbi:SPOSA6832_02100 [Sporobolomyces salmonicolor]|uniref:SPOSA6832_02100-mRNA-1:cds n=1 Tax=Sporidiobolus salmonicolor TaxID=5005 RepID=A0A0D6EL45_SPOSA|nr:SPOSA6832_02100 [Sporobolomyces salmonicolor]
MSEFGNGRPPQMPSSNGSFDREQGASSSYAPTATPQHLRQRSLPSSNLPGPSYDPFDDRNASSNESDSPPLVPMPFVPQPTPHRAAMMESASETSLVPASEAEQAMNMRGNRAEWQYLYSPSTLSHSAVAPPSLGYNGLRGSPASSIHSSPALGSSSANHSSRFDVSPTPDDYLFNSTTYPEPDDMLHDPGPKCMTAGLDRRIIEPKEYRKTGSGVLGISWMGLLNLLAVAVLVAALIMLFAGYPIYDWYHTSHGSAYSATSLGINGSSEIPDIPAFRGLVDPDTPESAYTRTGFDGKDYTLVFSDEFNTDGRIFYDGMDPFWEAVDLHYWYARTKRRFDVLALTLLAHRQTNDLEWYDPGNIYTEGGALVIELTKETKANSHGLGSWTMSNIGRAGFGGSLDGTWPYVCDVGTLANQTNPLTGEPKFTKAEGDQYNTYSLSYLPGQRFSRCTCSSETDHPGPQYANGTWKGRGAAEIDIFEATVSEATEIGQISQSAQWAPFNPSYTYINTSTEYVEFFDNTFETAANTYLGGAYQQGNTHNTTTDYQTYGFEYQPSEFEGYGTGYITWTQHQEEMWTLHDIAMGPNAKANISNRVVTAEPMYAIFNLGMSENFGFVDFDNLVFPAKLRIDSIRIWQQNDKINSEFDLCSLAVAGQSPDLSHPRLSLSLPYPVGCDTESSPTTAYIERNPELYYNPNVTLLSDVGRPYPKNSIIDTC